jgi:hypothetical protein
MPSDKYKYQNEVIKTIQILHDLFNNELLYKYFIILRKHIIMQDGLYDEIAQKKYVGAYPVSKTQVQQYNNKITRNERNLKKILDTIYRALLEYGCFNVGYYNNNGFYITLQKTLIPVHINIRFILKKDLKLITYNNYKEYRNILFMGQIQYPQ